MIAAICSSQNSLLYAQSQSDPTLADKIKALYENILQKGNTIEKLNKEDLVNLPVGLMKEVGGMNYMIIIDDAKFTPKGAFFSAYLILQFKATGHELIFVGRNIGFQPGGIGSSTSSKLELASEETIAISEDVNLILKADGRNYVEFDCNGFKSVSLNGIFEFDTDFLIPDVPEGSTGPEKVTATLEVKSNDWGSLIASTSITPFQIPDVKGLSFSVRDAVIDFSDIANPVGFQFPKDYMTSGGNINLWQGFYLREATVKIYKELESSKRSEITIRNMIIDHMGVSGAVDVKNLFGRDEGSLNGWPFSIDSLGIVVVKNQLKGAGLRGLVNIPMFDPTEPVKYSASVYEEAGENNFQFVIQPGRELKASVLSAEVLIDRNSSIVVSKQSGRLKPEAFLHGKIKIKSGSKLNLDDIAFQNVHLISEAPFITSGTFSFASKKEQKAATFPLSIKKLDFAFNSSEVKLIVKGALGLMNASDKGLSAEATIGVYGEIKQSEEGVGEITVKKQRWVYKDTKFSDIKIDMKTGVVNVSGSLSLFDQDPVYGNGFRGEVQATFGIGFAISLKSIAQFGNVKDLRYWYVDGMVKPPVPIGMGGFGFYGLGGGAYYHMSLQTDSKLSAKDFITRAGNSDKLTVGASRSESRYLPDPNTSFGFKAMVTIGVMPGAEALNGDASFEMSFNNSGGVRMIRFRGDGYFMSEIKYPRDKGAPLRASLDIVYDFTNSALHANLDTYVNIGGVLRGIGPEGLAGSAVLHFAPDEWYIYIGTPQQRIGLNFIGLVQAGAYFMVGTYLPGMPPPPQTVSDILGGMDLDFMRNENALANGGGFAFGASLEVKTPRIEIIIFYGQFSAGLGFDVMLKNYGSARCVGGGPIGINGWYASGQAWAYFQGSIGVFVDLWFIQGEFEILRIGAAAVLQAKLPNPFWMRGVVGGQFSILGGLIKGDCKFSITIGEECKIEGVSSVTGVKVIADVKPQSSDGEVDVFTTPQAAFNLAIDKDFEMLDLDGNYKAYRVKLGSFKVTSNGKDIPGNLQWNENKDVVLFSPDEILPPKSTVKVVVKVLWEQKLNGSWQSMMAGGKPEGEEAKTEFTTGVAPDYIPESNVLYSYPQTAQHNFMKNEYPQGYMKLKVGQSYLFEKKEGATSYDFVARFTPAGQLTSMNSSVTYSAGFISYNLPVIPSDKMMTIQFVKVPTSPPQAVDKNVTTSNKQIASSSAGTVTTTSKEIQGTVTKVEEKRLYHSYFRTSKFNSLNDKLNAMVGYRPAARIIPGLNIFEASAVADLSEVFDKTEVVGLNGLEPLVQLEALPDNPWYTEKIKPLVYEFYPVAPKMNIAWRNTIVAGIPPLRGISIKQDNALSLSEEDLFSSDATKLSGRIAFVYSLSFYAYKDFYELRQKAFDLYVDKNWNAAPIGAVRLMTTPYSDLMVGAYRFKIDYKLPGINKVTTTRTLQIDW
jgi:hypothetical protein